MGKAREAIKGCWRDANERGARKGLTGERKKGRRGKEGEGELVVATRGPGRPLESPPPLVGLNKGGCMRVKSNKVVPYCKTLYAFSAVSYCTCIFTCICMYIHACFCILQFLYSRTICWCSCTNVS